MLFLFANPLPLNINLIPAKAVDPFASFVPHGSMAWARNEMMEEDVVSSPTTVSTSYLHSTPSPPDRRSPWREASHDTTNIVINISSNDGSTGKGILIGMLSAFGSAAFVVLVFAAFYFFKYTNRGRIFLHRIGRPGGYDDEQAWVREEADALEDMDDLQRAEYLRAKGMPWPVLPDWSP